MATLLETIETECASLSIKVQLFYADLSEANATIFDKLQSGDFPICLVLPFDQNDNDRATTRINSEAELNIIFLDRFTGEQTIDKTTVQIENQFCAPMRTLTRELCNRLEVTDIINEDGIGSCVHRSTHEPIGDAHLYGNWAVVQIKYSEDVATNFCE